MNPECPCCRSRTRTWRVAAGLFAVWAVFPPMWAVVPPPPWGHRWLVANGYAKEHPRDRDRDDRGPPPKAGPRGHRPPPDAPPPPEGTEELW